MFLCATFLAEPNPHSRFPAAVLKWPFRNQVSYLHGLRGIEGKWNEDSRGGAIFFRTVGYKWLLTGKYSFKHTVTLYSTIIAISRAIFGPFMSFAQLSQRFSPSKNRNKYFGLYKYYFGHYSDYNRSLSSF